MKRLISLVLAAVMCLTLAACGSGTPAAPQSTEAVSGDPTYRVTVVDALGNPYSDGVIVRFMQDGAQAAMQVVGEDGVAEKALAKGDYTVELMFTDEDGEYYYDQTDLTLSAEKTELQITLAVTPVADPVTLHVYDTDYDAYPISEGGTYVELIPGERNYFLFTPARSGTYEISFQGDAEDIGYYGAPHFVQSENVAEQLIENGFILSISAGMIGSDGSGTAVIVLGIDAGDAENVTLTVERTGEPQYNVADEPWQIYQATVELTNYTLPAGASLRDFDLTADTDFYNLVLDEKGTYHLDSVDGPQVLVRLGVKNQYLDCFKTILEHTGVQRYFFDEDGAFLKKESYVDCLLSYIECMDQNNGVYPLTEDLKYIIQQEAYDCDWFNPNNTMYLFQDENGVNIDGINHDICWLFMCCYIAQ